MSISASKISSDLSKSFFIESQSKDIMKASQIGTGYCKKCPTVLMQSKMKLWSVIYWELAAGPVQ